MFIMHLSFLFVFKPIIYFKLFFDNSVESLWSIDSDGAAVSVVSRFSWVELLAPVPPDFDFSLVSFSTSNLLARSAGVVEYTNCVSMDG